MKGYKAVKKDKIGFYTDGMGNGGRVYWEKGKTYTVDGEIKLCDNGYHFFEHLCFAVEYFNEDTYVFECEALGEIKKDTHKCVTNKIKLTRLVTKKEISHKLDENHNSGNKNSGHGNSGNLNSGNKNSGHGNSGNLNSGNSNSGYLNSGHHNSGSGNNGDYNSGSGNSGYGNSGNLNSGWRNSGNWNSGNRNSGCFNRDTPKGRIFEKETDVPIDRIDFPQYFYFDLTEDYKASWKASIENASQDDIKKTLELPNFDADIFEEITGINIFDYIKE